MGYLYRDRDYHVEDNGRALWAPPLVQDVPVLNNASPRPDGYVQLRSRDRARELLQVMVFRRIVPREYRIPKCAVPIATDWVCTRETSEGGEENYPTSSFIVRPNTILPVYYTSG